MNHRTRLVGAVGAIALTAVALTGCSGTASGSSSGGKQTLTLFTDSDVGIQALWQKTLIPAFEKAHPDIAISFSAADGSTDSTQLAKITASEKQKKTPPMDVIVDAGFISDASAAGLLAPITKTAVPNLAHVQANTLAQSQTGEMPYRASNVVLAYDSTKVPNPPKTLPALLAYIKAHPGQFTYNDPSTGGAGQGFVQAVLDSHLDPATVTKMSVGYDQAAQSQWAAGFAQLKALTPSIYQKTYPQGNEGSLDLLGAGQVSMVPEWSDIFLTAQKTGSVPATAKTVSITGPDLPGGASYLAVPKNTTHLKAAQTLLNWVLQPAQQTQILEQVSGFPVIPPSDLPASTKSAFVGIDTTAEAPFYSSKSSADMNSQWSKLVP